MKIKKREIFSKKIIFIIFIFFFIWIFFQFLFPFILPTGVASNLSGQIWMANNEILINKMPFPIGLVYGCGDRLCHQIQERSFILNENQMPFCSRCTGIWLGFVIGLGFILFYKIEFDEKFIFVILIGIIPIGIDGICQLFGLWVSNNIVRLITGLLIGIVCGLAISIIIDELILIKNERL